MAIPHRAHLPDQDEISLSHGLLELSAARRLMRWNQLRCPRLHSTFELGIY